MDERLVRQNVQRAPYPEGLERLVEALEYRPSWRFELADDWDRDTGSAEPVGGLTFKVWARVVNSYKPEQPPYYVVHSFPVPAATYNEQSWRRWLLDCLIKVETHEACEFFQINGDRPYAPQHGPGNDPYIIFEHGSDVERRRSFRGDVKEEG